jgi:hypothetical protein
MSNTPQGILDYLVQRTEDTIGRQVDRSQVVIVGQVQTSEARNLPVRSEHVDALQPWLSGEVGIGPTITVHLTNVQVEKWLVGPGEAAQLELAYVYPALMLDDSSGTVPFFSVGERGLFFLQGISPDLPYTPYVPRPAYQLAPGENWARNFLVTDYDERGEPFTRDETAQVEETVAAVQWYAILPREGEDLHRALLQALDDVNPQVVRHAIRALAYRGGPAVAQAFQERLPGAIQERQVRLMLGLWILGERQAAQNVLEELFRVHGKDAWLTRWNIQPTWAEEGEPIYTLYGPDPAELVGD